MCKVPRLAQPDVEREASNCAQARLRFTGPSLPISRAERTVPGSAIVAELSSKLCPGLARTGPLATRKTRQARPLQTVLEWTASPRTVTYLGAYSGATVEPLQLFHADVAYEELCRKTPRAVSPRSAITVQSKSGKKGLRGYRVRSQALETAGLDFCRITMIADEGLPTGSVWRVGGMVAFCPDLSKDDFAMQMRRRSLP